MKTRYKMVVVIGIIAVLAFISIASSAESVGSASCQYFNAPFLGASGYTCKEYNGVYRSFFNPGAYDKMVNYYVPPLEQVEPPYTFVTGGSTETLSGN